MRKQSVIIANRHSTSISLEDEFFDELKELARQKDMSINQLVTEKEEAENLLEEKMDRWMYLEDLAAKIAEQ